MRFQSRFWLINSEVVSRYYLYHGLGGWNEIYEIRSNKIWLWCDDGAAYHDHFSFDDEPIHLRRVPT